MTDFNDWHNDMTHGHARQISSEELRHFIIFESKEGIERIRYLLYWTRELVTLTLELDMETIP